MHLLVAAHDLYPDPGSGGTGRYVYETGRRLAERGHRVSVVTRRRGGQPPTSRVEGMDVRRYDLAVAGHGFPAIARQLPGAVGSVRDHLAEVEAGAGRPDVVSFQGPATALLVDALVGADRPRSLTFHSPWPTEYDLRVRGGGRSIGPRRRLNVHLRRWLERQVVDAADQRLVLSDAMRGAIDRLYDPDGAVEVIPGGVDVDRFSPDAGRFGPVAGDERALCTVRRLTPRMGHDRLLSAFAAVAPEFEDVHLYVAGDGPLREPLERRARRLGVGDRTTFLGYVPDADLPALYATADLFVLPTAALEGFGLATLEALASGTPVVATPVGGTPEVVEPFEGLEAVPEPMLVPAATASDLAAGIGGWLRRSPAERTAAGRACRRLAERSFTWERTVDALEGRYERLLERRG